MSAPEAKPFDFAAFDAQFAEPAPAEPTFTHEDIDEACAQARAEAFRSVEAEALRNQTALLETIAAGLDAQTSAAKSDLDAHKEDLSAVCHRIVEGFCLSASTLQTAEAASDLITRFLNSGDADGDAVLELSAECDETVVNDVRKTAKGASITVETSDAMSLGEVRLKWRSGAMERIHDNMRQQIADIFAGLATPSAKISKKGTSS
jgi:hypothetical protein